MRWQIVRQLRYELANAILLGGHTQPFAHGANRYILIIGYILDAAHTLLPNFSQGLFLAFS